MNIIQTYNCQCGKHHLLNSFENISMGVCLGCFDCLEIVKRFVCLMEMCAI